MKNVNIYFSWPLIVISINTLDEYGTRLHTGFWCVYYLYYYFYGKISFWPELMW